jgi:hypothetical protein
LKVLAYIFHLTYDDGKMVRVAAIDWFPLERMSGIRAGVFEVGPALNCGAIEECLAYSKHGRTTSTVMCCNTRGYVRGGWPLSQYVAAAKEILAFRMPSLDVTNACGGMMAMSIADAGCNWSDSPSAVVMVNIFPGLLIRPSSKSRLSTLASPA